ncbi:hypothetical protein ACNAW0_29490 [Micromonospora sp. SL1-18]|uniref:hypothetical protein n=1 Tax=Micromonospora sp. SL1-18 TaxID=3399128 RepID=UPI003A4D96BF
MAVALETREEDLIHHHEDVSPEAVSAHRLVLRAVRDGDADRAERRMREMLWSLLDESSNRHRRTRPAESSWPVDPHALRQGSGAKS